jgi:hypothetical protein
MKTRYEFPDRIGKLSRDNEKPINPFGVVNKTAKIERFWVLCM